MKYDIQKWAELDSKWNDGFAQIPIVHKNPIVLKVRIISGSDIHRGSIRDLVDKPNPQIEIEYSKAKGEKIYMTEAIKNTINPVWNEKFRFVLPDEDDENHHDEGVLKFRLYVENLFGNPMCIGEAEFDASKLNVGDNFEDKISFEKAGQIQVKITKRQKTHLRLSLSLNDKEMEFRKKRLPKVMKAMQKTFGKETPGNIFETPIISIIGSGGGIRAMTGMCGIMDGLDDIGLQDCMTYAFGTSGSSWYLTGLYTRHALGEDDNREDYHTWLRESFTTSAYYEFIKKSNIAKGTDMFNKKKKLKQPYTLVDYYGICMTNKVVGKEFLKHKLSDMRNYVDRADVPYPILDTSQVQDDMDVKTYRADCTFSAFECEFLHYGINLNIQRLNSEFYDGVMERNLPEPDLSFIIGTLGSAFATGLNRILGINAEEDNERVIESFFSTLSMDNEYALGLSWEAFKNKLPQFRGRNKLIPRSGKILNVARGLENMKRFRINPAAGDPKEIPDGFDEDKDIIDLVDGGILCNVAIDAALRPQRKSDILFIADFSSYDGDVNFQTLKSSIQLAKNGGYKFPPIDLEKIKSKGVDEFYIFEDPDDSECPVVFWFMMSAKKFREEREYTPRNPEVLQDLPRGKRFTDFSVYESDMYDTLDLSFTNLEFDRLRELMAYNVKINGEKIKRKIKERIAMKRKLNESSGI